MDHDFSRVRVHVGGEATESARQINARAYTFNNHIVFGADQYTPSTSQGRHLLAHELAHVVQQDGMGTAVNRQTAPTRQELTHVHGLIQRDEVEVDLEVPTPQEQARLRQQGVQLPSASAQATDPRTHSDFIDRRLDAVGFGIYLSGYHLYCQGLVLPAFVPDAYVDLTLTNMRPINHSIYPDRAAAMADIPYGPLAPGQPLPFAYYRGVGGLVVPTVFSPATSPRTVQTMLEARRQLAQEVQEALTVLALSLVTGAILRGVYNRLVRAGGRAPAGTRNPTALGEEIGIQVKSMPAGKRATIATRISNARLSQADAATATGAASRVAFGRIGGTVRQPNGDLVVPSVQLGPNQPVFVVRPNGRVLPARATISGTQPPSVANPIQITNVTIE